ncbi:MAG: carbohydrate kinase [Deltaproteobacteria bacterium]|nr:carbohydrate kinase [Deltaproteobacteria bacterium]
MTDRRARVVCFGEALVDLFPASLDARGRPLAAVETFRRCVGGAPANVAVGLGRLGVRAALLSYVGRDAFGDFLRGALETDGVEVRGVESLPARTGITFVSWDAAGERSFLFYRHGSADALLDVGLVERHAELVAESAVVQLGTSTLVCDPAASATRRLLELCHAARTAIGLDLNLRLHLWPSRDAALEAARWLARQATVLKADAGEAFELTGERDPERAAQALLALGPRLVAVTCGDAGAVWASPAASGRAFAAPVVVKDSTGAGDGFCAGLLAALLEGASGADPAALCDQDAASLARAVQRGCWAGSLVCREVGAVSSAPRREELEELGRLAACGPIA